ncbi:hypothetical protein GCM10010238_39420 [Streptomyces griseoviridis]|uniref:Uncharacterized protein n=1 Tax=Streptomyces griseoviridis TaxID=45398 RepID=A0A918GMS3_STRGD|nr:hypothetical protein GCM10010238_39420 [Streptomyces niveoruber]
MGEAVVAHRRPRRTPYRAAPPGADEEDAALPAGRLDRRRAGRTPDDQRLYESAEDPAPCPQQPHPGEPRPLTGRDGRDGSHRGRRGRGQGRAPRRAGTARSAAPRRRASSAARTGAARLPGEPLTPTTPRPADAAHRGPGRGSRPERDSGTGPDPGIASPFRTGPAGQRGPGRCLSRGPSPSHPRHRVPGRPAPRFPART